MRLMSLLGYIPEVLSSWRHKRFITSCIPGSQVYGAVDVYWAGKPVLVLSQPDLIQSTVVQGMRSGSLARSPGTRQTWNDMRGPILISKEGSPTIDFGSGAHRCIGE